MAKHLYLHTALFLFVSVFATGCSVDAPDPDEQVDVPAQSEDSSSKNNAPAIELRGEAVITIPVGSSFTDPGVVAIDAEDGDLTDSVYSNSMQVDTGRPGRYEITYRVADSADAQAVPVKRLVIVSEVAPDELSVPRITYVEWVVLGESGKYLALTQIKEGDELDLSLAAGRLVNIIAQSEDTKATGSVHFLLNGPVEIDRIENNPAYALANEKSHLNVAAGELPPGDYALVVTPYTEADAGGVAGMPHVVNFTVKNTPAEMPEPEVVVVANNDSYTYESGSDMQPGQVRAVSENDVYDLDAVFTITKAPRYGSAQMFDLGFFTYKPRPDFIGTDSFTYQIAQSGKTVSATVSLKVEGGAVGATSGFTAIKPSSDTKQVYVSSSLGDDANTCLSEASPCKTIKAGLAKMRNGYPDHLYLKRGDVWRGERLFNLHSGRSVSEPAVMTYYGSSGARPKIENENSTLHIMKGKMMNFSFVGIEFSAYKMDPKNPEFTGDAHANIVLLGGNENILFEDNVFNYTEIIIQEYGSGNPANITLRRNIWTGSYSSKSSTERNERPSNLYAAEVSGLLIEENVFDFGGWNPTVPGAGANMFNHNLYIQYSTDGNKLVVRNNIITRASSHGVHGRPGGLFENNFFARNAISLQMGYNGHPLPAGVKAQAIDNVITEGQSMVKGIGACTGTNLCTPAVWGLVINEPGQGQFLLKNNIVHSLLEEDTDWSSRYNSLQISSISQRTGDQFLYEGNIAWQWAASNSTGGGFKAPGRTLADYNKSLGGEKDFDAFMDKVKSRPLGTWDVRYSASAINQYVREGFNK
jgi:hypothetical protein